MKNCFVTLFLVLIIAIPMALVETAANATQEIQYCTKAIAVTPNNSELYNKRSKAYAKTEQYVLAFQDFNKAML